MTDNKTFEKCPNCDDVGGFYVGEPYGEYDVQACEFCHTIPNSFYNIKQTIQNQKELIELYEMTLVRIKRGVSNIDNCLDETFEQAKQIKDKLNKGE